MFSFENEILQPKSTTEQLLENDGISISIMEIILSLYDRVLKYINTDQGVENPVLIPFALEACIALMLIRDDKSTSIRPNEKELAGEILNRLKDTLGEKGDLDNLLSIRNKKW